MKCYFCGFENETLYYSCYIEKYNKDREINDNLNVSFNITKYKQPPKGSVMCKSCFIKNVGDVIIKVINTIEDLDKDKIVLNTTAKENEA